MAPESTKKDAQVNAETKQAEKTAEAAANTEASAAAPAADAAAEATAPAGRTVLVTRPVDGGTLTLEASPGGQMNLGFDPGNANASRDGNDLIFDIDGSGRVVLKDFFVVGDESLPNLRLPDGNVVATADFFAGSDLDMSTAAGPGAAAAAPVAQAPGSGGTNYSDMAGDLLGGVDKYGKLGTFYWGREAEIDEEHIGLLFPRGDFSLSLTTEDGTNSATFAAFVAEDAQPHQNIDGPAAELVAARLMFNFNTVGTTTVSQIRFTDFPEGMQLYLGDPAEGGKLIELENGIYVLKVSDFTTGVYLIPPANTHDDFPIQVEVDFSNGSTTETSKGSLTVIVDAVADLPLDVNAVLDSVSDHSMVEESTKFDEVNDKNGDGFISTDMAISKNAATEPVTVTITVNALFTDVKDGSEGHYILVEKIDGLTLTSDIKAEAYTETVDGVEYWVIRVDGEIKADGTVKKTVTFEAQPTTQDTEYTVKAGAMTVEEKVGPDYNDVEPDKSNNVSHVTVDVEHKVVIDAISSDLHVDAGWASESNDSEKHGMGTTSDAGKRDDGTNGKDGAPINFELNKNDANSFDNDAKDYFTKITVSITPGGGGAPGTLEYIESQFPKGCTFDRSADGQSITITFPKGSDVDSIKNGIFFEPKEGYSDNDVPISFVVDLANSTGSSATFKGNTTVAIDAVADKPIDLSADGEWTRVVRDEVETEQLDSHTRQEGKDVADGFLDSNHELYGDKADIQGIIGEAKVTVRAQFADRDGSEEHFLIVQVTDEFVPDSDRLVLGKDGQPLLYSATQEDGTVVQYWMFKVLSGDYDTKTGDVELTINLKTPGLITEDIPSFSLRTGAVARESDTRGAEYRTDNNESLSLIPVEDKADWATVEIDMVEASLDMQAGWASEGNNAHKHVKPADRPASFGDEGGYVGGTDASKGAPINFSLNQKETDSDNFDFIRSITVSLTANQDGKLVVDWDALYDGGNGVYDATEGEVTYDDGTVIKVTFGANDHSVTITFPDNMPEGPTYEIQDAIHYLPREGSFSDADVSLEYTVKVENPAGSSVVLTGESTVIVDAVADIPVNLDTSLAINNEQHAATSDNVEKEGLVTDGAKKGFDSGSDGKVAAGVAEDGFLTSEHTVAADDGVKMTVRATAEATFPDYGPDSSEVHYVYIEKSAFFDNLDWTATGQLPGAAATDPNYYIVKVDTTQPSTYQDGPFTITVSFETQPDGTTAAKVTVVVSLVTKDGLIDDTTAALSSAAVASVETPDGEEYRTINNTAHDDSADTVFIDVVNSGVNLNVGWASESNNDAKHQDVGSRDSGDYQYNGSGQANWNPGNTLVENDGSTNIGAPVNFSLTPGTSTPGGSQEFFEQVTITIPNTGIAGEFKFDADALPNGVTVSCTTKVVDGQLTYTFTFEGWESVYNTPGFNPNDLNLNNVIYFEPNNSNSHADVNFSYTVQVGNEAGASLTFSGNSSVVIDAVADMAGLSHTDFDYGTTTVTDGLGNTFTVNRTALEAGELRTVNFNVDFPDTKGGEEHFVLIERPAGMTFTTVTLTVDGKPVVFTVSGNTLTGPDGTVITGQTGSDGKTQFEIPLGKNSPGCDVAIDAKANPTSVQDYPIRVGGKSTVEGSDGEYDRTNNEAIKWDTVTVKVTDNNAAGREQHVDTFESRDGTNTGNNIDPNKHATASDHNTYSDSAVNGGASITYEQTTVTGDLGKITFSLHNPDAASPEYITKLTFTVDGNLNDLGTFLYGDPATAIPQHTGGTPPDGPYYVVNSNGTTTVHIPVALEGSVVDGVTVLTGGATDQVVTFVPKAWVSENLEISDYTFNTVNLQSGETATTAPGAPVTVNVDAVASRPLDIADDDVSIDYSGAEDYDKGRVGTQSALDFDVTFTDMSDTDEVRSLLIQAPNNANNPVRYDYIKVTIDGQELTFTLNNSATPPTITSSATGDTVTLTLVTLNGQQFYRITSDSINELLQTANDDSSDQVTLHGELGFTPQGLPTAGGTSATGDKTFTITVGGMAHDPEHGSEGSEEKWNDAAFSTKPVVVELAEVTSTVEVRLENGQAYENAHKTANQGYLTPAEVEAKLEAGDTTFLDYCGKISVNLANAGALDSNGNPTEAITEVQFVLNNGTGGNPCNILFHGQLLTAGDAVDYSPEGYHVELALDGSGNLTVVITMTDGSALPQNLFENSNNPIYVVPVDSHHEDITIDYKVTVTDNQSGAIKEFVPDTDDDPMKVAVDAVAQKPDIVEDGVDFERDEEGRIIGLGKVVDSDSNPLAVTHGGDGVNKDFYDYTSPGDVANILIPVQFHGDQDSSQSHFIYIEQKGSWNPVLEGDGSGNITILVNGHPVLIYAHEITSQNFNLENMAGEGTGANTQYFKIQLPYDDPTRWPADADGNNTAIITVPITTDPASSGKVEIKVGASSVEKTTSVGQDGEDWGANNNQAFTSDKVVIEFDSNKQGAIGVTDGFYEDGRAEANIGNNIVGRVIDIDITLNHPYAVDGEGVPNGGDYLTAIKINAASGSEDLGTLWFFPNPTTYAKYGELYDAYVVEYKAWVAGGEVGAEPQCPTPGMAGAMNVTALGGTIDLIALAKDPNYSNFTMDDLANFKGQLVFEPKSGNSTTVADYNDADFNFSYTLTVVNSDTGQVSKPGAGGTIVGDAVAQIPDKPVIYLDEGNKSTDTFTWGDTYNVTLTGTFTDVDDATTEHFMLVQVKPNWTVEYKDAGGNWLPQEGAKLETITLKVQVGVDGEGNPVYENITYYKIPVDPSQFTDVNKGSAAVDVRMSAPDEWDPAFNSDTTSGGFRTGAYSEDLTDRSGELTKHNNTAFVEGDLVDLKINDGEGHGPRLITVKDLYEDNMKNGHLGDTNQEAGSIVINTGNADDNSTVWIKVPFDSTTGEPIVTIDGFKYLGNGVYEVELKSGVATGAISTNPKAYEHKDGDFKIEYSTVDPGEKGAGFVPDTSKTESAVVDAVADYVEVGGVTSVDLSTPATVDPDRVAGGGDKNDNEATFFVKVAFPDNDGSEEHFILVEQIPGWDIPGATTVTYNGENYYKVPVDSPYVTQVTGGYDVTAVYNGADPKSFVGDHAPDAKGGGVWEFEVKVGTMVEETNTGSKGNLEITLDNNIAIAIDEDDKASLYYSPVNSNITIETTDTYENYGSKDSEYGNGVTIKISDTGFDANNDELHHIIVKYNPDQGTLSLNGTPLPNGYKLEGTELKDALANGLQFIPKEFTYNDPKIDFTSKITDTLSGAERNVDSSVTIKQDAVAHGHKTDNDKPEMGSSSAETGMEAVKDGENATITIKTDFIDLKNTTEEHWVVVENNNQYHVEGMKVYYLDSEGNRVGDPVIVGHDQLSVKYDQAGNLYYAYKLAYGQNAEIEVNVTTPMFTDTSKDYSKDIKAGTISVENTRDGEWDLQNNWHESIDNVTIETGIINTVASNVGLSDLEGTEDGFVILEISGLSTITANNEEVTWYKIEGLAADGSKGTLHLVKEDGTLDMDTSVYAPDGSLTAAALDALLKGKLAYQPPADANNNNLSVSLTGSAVVVDKASGAESEVLRAPDAAPVNIIGEVDGTTLSVTATDASGLTTLPGHAASFSHAFTVNFEGATESCFLVFSALPGGVIPQSVTIGSQTYNLTLGKFDATQTEDCYFLQLPSSVRTSADVTVNVQFKVTADDLDNLPTGGEIKAYTASVEAGAEDATRIATSPEVTVNVTILEDVLNNPVQVISGMENIGDTIGLDDILGGTYTMGTVNGVFTDADGQGDFSLGIVGAADNLGTLTENASGELVYTLNNDSVLTIGPDAQDTFTVTATDAFGETATSTISVNFDNNYVIGTSDDNNITTESYGEILYGGGGSDTFAWTVDKFGGDTDTIADFEYKQVEGGYVGDKLSFADIIQDDLSLDALLKSGNESDFDASRTVTLENDGVKLKAEFTEAQLILTLEKAGESELDPAQAQRIEVNNAPDAGFNVNSEAEALAVLENIIKVTSS